MGHFIPHLSNQEQQITASEIERPLNDSLRAVAGDRHTDRLTDPTIAAVQRRSFGYADLI